MDTKKLQSDLQALTVSKNKDLLYPQTILKTLMIGCFLEQAGY